jgi:6-phosphofructokinase 1
VVAAEGSMPEGGQAFYKNKSDNPEAIASRYGGIGVWLSHKLQEITGIESRAVVLGHLQRGGSPTTFDRFLSTRFGVGAIELIDQGKFGQMVCIRGRNIESVSLKEATKEQKKVDPNGRIVRMAEKLGITFGRPENAPKKNSKK